MLTADVTVYKHTFPENATTTNVVVDVSHVLPSFRGQGLGQSYRGGNLTVETSESGDFTRYTGAGSYDNVSSKLLAWRADDVL